MKNKHQLAISLIILIIVSSCTFLNKFAKENSNIEQPTNSKFIIKTDTAHLETPLDESKIPESDFSSSTINRNIPENILKEITYFGGGGGGICVQEGLYWVNESFGKDMEIMTLDHIFVCGWKENENVNVQINFPDNRSIQKNIKAINEDDGFYYVSLDLKFDLDAPEGKYDILLTGETGEISAFVNVHKPDEIRLYRIDEDHLLLYNFFPSESVNLYYYENEEFYGWQEYIVSKQGQLIIKIPVDKMKNYVHYKSQFFVAIGEKSGETHLLFETDSFPRKVVYQDKILWVCGDFSTRLNLFIEAEVSFVDGEDLLVRESPGINSNIVGKISEGTKISIGGENPICTDDITWWKISGNKTIPSGWVAEYDLNNYLLVPVN